jgi:hypothetical protein
MIDIRSKKEPQAKRNLKNKKALFRYKARHSASLYVSSRTGTAVVSSGYISGSYFSITAHLRQPQPSRGILERTKNPCNFEVARTSQA